MAVHFNHESPVARSTFARGKESLVVECLGSAEIVLAYGGAPEQRLRFDDPVALVFFQSDLERELVRTGWTLMEFESIRQPAKPAALLILSQPVTWLELN